MNIERTIYGIDVEIEFDYTKGRPAVMYLRNGDPGYPEEPAEVVINEINIGKFNMLDFLCEGFISRCEEECFEAADDFERERGYSE